MRLINVHTRQLEEFVGNAVPKYAILSHTWEDQEATYGHYIKGSYEHMKGYYKINMTCRMAEQRDLSYAWVDTCCIDKSSSAELSEAMNSMYRWYRGARVCFAYLSDLAPNMDWTENLPKCRWFTRGWTLQELIAPHNMVFFDSAWSSTIKSEKRTKMHLIGLLSNITRVDELLLSNRRSVRDGMYSVAQKMSWAARRKTTRVEDKAYCLLGIFDINMPLLYGEGDRAFIRLQEEIMRSKADMSILAWQLPYSETSHVLNPGPRDVKRSNMLAGVLAQSPADFEQAGKIVNIAKRQVQEFSTTNVGIKLRTRLYLDPHRNMLILPLPCVPADSGKFISIALLHLGNERYLRLDPFSVYTSKFGILELDVPIDRYLLLDHSLASGSQKRWASLSKVKIRTRRACLQIMTSTRDENVVDPWPLNWYDRAEQLFFVDNDPNRDMCCARVDLSNRFIPQDQDCCITLIAVGWSDEANEPQFGMFFTRDYGGYIEQLQDRALKAHYDAEKFLHDLKWTGIPRTMSLRITLPEMDQVAVITVHPTLSVSDVHGRTQRSWKVSFLVEVYPAGKAPAVQQLEWDGED